jgi:hypothetical protein
VVGEGGVALLPPLYTTPSIALRVGCGDGKNGSTPPKPILTLGPGASPRMGGSCAGECVRASMPALGSRERREEG